MITELQIVQQQTIPGRKIVCVAYSTNNHNLHKMMKPVSHLLLWMLEADSNNSSRTIVPTDVLDVWACFSFMDAEIEICEEYSSQPTGARELTYKIVFPEALEMVRFKNMKWERVAQQIMHFARVAMGVDSGRVQGYVDMADFKLIKESLRVTKAIATRFIGDGKPIDGKKGEFNTGLKAPALAATGIIKPDNDLDVAVVGEPSADRPESMLPDVADTPAPTRNAEAT